MLGVRDQSAGVALRATFIVDPDNVIQHVSVNNLNVGRNPEERFCRKVCDFSGSRYAR